MAKEREYVVVDDFAKYPDIKTLKAVVQGVSAESAEVLEELRAEIRKRTQEMLADAAEAGVVVSEVPAPKKRGPKPKTKAADSEAPEGWSEAETAIELDAE
jgi:LAS superfamily LD-carboxypeptidase LdcB